jgi:uncharacterized FAD-dependent dehydrogenase
MGFRVLELEMPPDFSRGQLEKGVASRLKGMACPFIIEKQSLDARKKSSIHWKIRVIARSPALSGPEPEQEPEPEIPRSGSGIRAVVAGSGPAGIFAALALAESGARVTLIERGEPVEKRTLSIDRFEGGGAFPETGNYPFGEGGAGTFSDGKLTSRTKSIGTEKLWFFSRMIAAGAPPEIGWLTHPHVGSDNLVRITRSLRDRLLSLGGEILFNTRLTDLDVTEGRVTAAVTADGKIDGTHFFVASGHSATDTLKMLMSKGVPYRVKSTAIGFRAEHRQEIINKAQWGVPAIPGIKGAEYRLTAAGDVYTFCMCPGGRVVPSSAFPGLNIVNGMSLYARGGPFANAAVVAAVNPSELFGQALSPEQALDWLESLERGFYEYAGGYGAPSCSIASLLGRKGSLPAETSYPFPLVPADFAEIFPRPLLARITTGLAEFDRRLSGYAGGTLMGLESKTSSPVQVERDDKGASGYPNLYVIGEGSGRSGGIVSSAADGIKTVLRVLQDR